MMESGPSVFYAPTATRIANPHQRVDGRAVPPEIRDLLAARQADFRLSAEQLPRGMGSGALTTPIHIACRSQAWLAAGGLSYDGKHYRYWVGIWNRGAGQPSTIYRGHLWTPLHVTVSRDGRRAASVDRFGDVHVWDTSTGKRLFLFPAAPHQPLFSVAWNNAGTGLLFGTRPYPSQHFKDNRFGELAYEFDLAQRFVRELPSEDRRSPPAPDPELGIERDTSDPKITIKKVVHRGIRGAPAYADPNIGEPMCYQRIACDNPLLDGAVAIGYITGEVRLVDFSQGEPQVRAELLGHAGFVTGISLSPDRELLATSSADGTIRIWKLDELQEVGDVDFEVRGNQVIATTPGSEAARMGIQKGDRILRFANTSYYESRELLLYGLFRPGDTVSLEMEHHKSAKRYTIDRFRLQPSFARAQPLLSLLLTKDNEWVLWTREGFYDASPHGDQHIGWHRNRTREEAAEFFSARQFREVMFRPDILDQVVQGWDIPQAVAMIEPRLAPPALDLRDEFVSQATPPRIKIIEPREAATRSQEIEFVVEVLDTADCRVGQVEFECNGRRPEAPGAFEPGPGATRLFRQRLRLDAADNEIHIVAKARDVRTRSVVRSDVQTVRLRCEVAPRADLPQLFVLAIGVATYAHPAMANLQYCHHDAEGFAAAWKQQQGRQYGEVQTRVLTNEQATTANVLKAFDWLSESVEEDDCVAILLSGHGLVERGNYYLASHDADPDSLRSSAVSYAQIQQLVEEDLRPRILMLFVDTCHGGGVLGAKGNPQRFDGWRDALVTVFASCLPSEISVEHADWKNGAFTEALLEALEQWRADSDHDGQLTLAELDQYLSHRVAQLTHQRQHPSAKRLLTLPSGFIIARKP